MLSAPASPPRSALSSPATTPSKSVSAFANGDPKLGSWYVFEAIFMLFVAYKLGKAAKAGHNMIHKKTVPRESTDVHYTTHGYTMVKNTTTVTRQITTVVGVRKWLLMSAGIALMTGPPMLLAAGVGSEFWS